MHPSQARAIRLVEEGINRLSDSLVFEYDIDEDEALEIVRNLPELTDKIQEGEYRELYEVARRKVHGRVNLPYNPKERFPGHPKFMPPVTSKDTFNDNMAQAMSPYVIAIARKIALDRGVQPPNEAAIRRVLDQTDWSKAAYEAKRMGKRPSNSRLAQWMRKWIGRPVGKIADFPFEYVFGMVGFTTTMWIFWHTFNDRLAQLGEPLIGAVIRFADWRGKYKRHGR
jgi:hypothetical protein